MPQHSTPASDRRCEPRQSQAFAFWFRPSGGHQRASGWMVDMSRGGAAFLTTPAELPAVGERIELMEMFAADRLVREECGPLPRFARVLRHDRPEGLTRRVAVRFEADSDEPCDTTRRQFEAQSQPRSRVVPPPPPAIDAGTDRRRSIPILGR